MHMCTCYTNKTLWYELFCGEGTFKGPICAIIVRYIGLHDNDRVFVVTSRYVKDAEKECLWSIRNFASFGGELGIQGTNFGNNFAKEFYYMYTRGPLVVTSH